MTDLPPWDVLLGWVTQGQRLVERAAADLEPGLLPGPSRLVAWSRGHVLSHLARNADALTNLLIWARTGVESRMYSSSEEREHGIRGGADRELPEQVADLTASGSRFLAAAHAVPEPRRSFSVISGHGRQIAAHEVPWLRVREVWLHLVDLDAGYGIDILPPGVAWTLTKDVAAWMTQRTTATVDLRVDGYGTVRLGAAASADRVVEGSPQRIAGWLTGRTSPAGLTRGGELPGMPRWL